jgi:tRNA(Arg) A34 adenosine deaminase TadA
MSAFADRADRYVRERLPAAAPHSAEEMFLRLLERGVHAREAGNYGIAAAFVVRSRGIEVVCFGESSLFADRDPAGHAEMNAMRAARGLLDGERAPAADAIHVRKAPHDRFEALLYSTLEPCPMCTVAILNAGIEEVVVGIPDEAAGAMLRLETLTPIWSQIATQRQLRATAVTTDGAGPHRVPNELLELLAALFFDEKEPLDERLARGGILPAEDIATAAGGSAASQ